MGRPTKLTPALLGMITQAVALGVPVVSAGGHAGVSRACLLEWLQRGQGTHPTRPATKAYAAFVEAIEKARAQDEVRRVARLEQAARGGEVTYEKTTTYPDGRVIREVRRRRNHNGPPMRGFWNGPIQTGGAGGSGWICAW